MDKVLDELSSGVLSPEEAFTSLRTFLSERKGREPSEQVYEAVRGIVWQLVSSRESGDHILQWQNTLLKVKQLVRRNDEHIAERFIVLADFLGQSARFREIHAPQEIRQRKHVMDVLRILAEARRPVDRKTIEIELRLKTANLSRVLSNLAAEGLVQRRYRGRDVEVSLTADGEKIYSEYAASLPARVVQRPAGSVFSEQFSKHWPRDICSAAVSYADDIVFCHNEFSSVFLQHKNLSPKSWNVTTLRNCITHAADTSDEIIPDEVATPDGRTFRVIERPTPDGWSVWLSMDVTEYRRRLDIYERRERLLKNELVMLRQLVHGKTGTHVSVAEEPLHMLATVKRDLLTPANAIFHAASVLLEAKPIELSLQLADTVTDIFNFSRKLRDFTRAFVKIGEASAHPILLADPFTPDDVLQRVIQNLAITLRHSDVVIRLTKKVKDSVVGDEIAIERALMTTLAGIVASGSITPVSVKQKLTTNELQFDVFCAVDGRDMEVVDAMATSMLSCDAAIKQMGMDFRFNSTAKGYNASIVAQVKHVGAEAEVHA
jgi:predicted transcriptional regulator